MKEIFEYIKKRNPDGKMRKVGILVGIKDIGQNSFAIGWSKVNEKMGDRFDLTKGLTIAKSRCMAGSKNLPDIPSSIQNKFRQFQHRCTRFFKHTPMSAKGAYLAEKINGGDGIVAVPYKK
jgi:hypothetical protein